MEYWNVGTMKKQENKRWQFHFSTITSLQDNRKNGKQNSNYK